MYDQNHKLIQAIHKTKRGEVALVQVNNFFSLLKQLGFNDYFNLINDLSVKINNCYGVVSITCNALWVVSNSIVIDNLENIIADYILENKVYLYISIDKNFFDEDTLLDELYYNMQAKLSLHNTLIDIKSDKLYSLYKALHHSKLFMALQPIVTVDGNLYCYECLLRINDSLFCSTAEIIEVAEKTGLIGKVDEAILRCVIDKVKSNPGIIVSINVSYRNIQNEKWRLNFINTIQNHNIARNIIIEITETVLRENYTIITHFVNQMHKVGAQIALDDFGTGYTSFVQLKSFNVDFLKIDGIFIRSILYDKSSALFTKSIIEISHSLGIKVIAECVESVEVVNLLKEWGVDLLQGFYFGKPWPEE